MLTKTTTLNLKNGKIIIQTHRPYVVDLKYGNHLSKYRVVYSAVYYPFINGEYVEDQGICGWIKHDTIVSRDSFDRIEDSNALFINVEIFNSETGSNMTLEDDEK